MRFILPSHHSARVGILQNTAQSQRTKHFLRPDVDTIQTHHPVYGILRDAAGASGNGCGQPICRTDDSECWRPDAASWIPTTPSIRLPSRYYDVSQTCCPTRIISYQKLDSRPVRPNDCLRHHTPKDSQSLVPLGQEEPVGYSSH